MPAELSEQRLPRPLSSFIGREAELAEVRSLLVRSRLLTLTGPGGSGKTRLGIELARRAGPDYSDGAFFVPLAAIRDPNLVPSSIAQSLGLQDSRGRPLAEHLASYLAERELLLVLDNFEQLLDAARLVRDLLSSAESTRIVVTSRAPLRISGEQEYAVPPLPVPGQDVLGSPAELIDCASVALFASRAASVVPDFTVNGRNAQAVAGIVRRLDGLPLAIELAAARIKHLPPAGVLERLDDALGLLTGGSRDLPDRQQTLRSTIAWSYDLLSEGARRLFAVCAVFRGGMGLEAIEAVCAGMVDLGVPTIDAVQELVDQSLLRLAPRSERPRYTMLETVREFAAEMLSELPQAEQVRASHAAVYCALSDAIERPPIWPDNEFLALLDLEHDNVRAALDWSMQHDLPRALQTAANLTAFWSVHGHFTEGRQRLRELLEAAPMATAERVRALNGAGWLALDQGDLDDSVALLDESVALARALGDEVGVGTALLNRGRASLGGQDIEVGGRDIDAALTILTGVGDERGAAAALMFSGLAPQFTGHLEEACARFVRCTERCADLGLHTLRARALQLLGLARLQLGDVAGARAALTEGIPVVVRSGDRFGIAVGLGGLLAFAVTTDRPRLALRLLGVIDEYSDVNQVMPPQPLRELTERFLSAPRAALGAAAEALRAEGRRTTVDDAVALVLAEEPEQTWRSGAGPALTGRESEVATLVARGLTNREIAGRLYLSVRTVDVHVDRIFTKLGIRNRSQLTAWAHERGLVAGE